MVDLRENREVTQQFRQSAVELGCKAEDALEGTARRLNSTVEQLHELD